MRENSVLARWSPAQVRRVWIVYWVALFALMHTPRERLPEVRFSTLATTVHVTGYALLGLLGAAFAERSGTPIGAGWYGKWLLIYAVYAAADELLQRIVDRSPDARDWAADMFGVVVAFAIVRWGAVRARAARERR